MQPRHAAPCGNRLSSAWGGRITHCLALSCRSVSASTDCTVKLWKVPHAPNESGPVMAEERPVYEFEGKNPFRGIDHHWSR